MSEQPTLGGPFVDDVFASVLGALAPDDASEAEGTPAAPAAQESGEGTPAPAGVPAPAGEPAAAAPAGEPEPGGDGAGASDAAPADAGGDSGAAEPADAGPDGGDRVPAGTVDYAAVSGDLSGLSQKFEERTVAGFQQEALTAVQEEYNSYFEALKQHPRMLVGTEVPALQGEGMETLRDANDAREWQEAVKQLLTEEVRERATVQMEENKGIVDTVHQSIELFTKNPDMVPGTRQFDRQLADRFAAMVKPYELRVEGKLHGYTIPVQPLIEQLRHQLKLERAKTPAAPAAPAKAPARGAKTPAADQPQRGIGTKAGSSSEEPDDFSTLFGTLGLPNLKI